MTPDELNLKTSPDTEKSRRCNHAYHTTYVNTKAVGNVRRLFELLTI